MTDRRLIQFHATQDTAALWPETTPAQRVAGYRQIVAAATDVLAGRIGRLTPADPLDTRALGVAAFLAGMGPLLAWWIDEGKIEASRPVRDLLREHLSHNRRRLARTTRELREVLGRLARRGIVPAILKGTYTAHGYFPDPATRTGSDTDLFAGPAELPAVRDALQGLGMACLTRHTLPEREQWGPPDAQAIHSLELAHEHNPWSIDIHVSLDRTYFPGLTAGLGTPASAAFADWPGPFGPARVLRQPVLIAHLALNAGSDFPDGQLVRTVELVQVIRQDVPSGELDWMGLRELLDRTGTSRFAFPAFAAVEHLSPGTVDPGLLELLERDATPRMRRLVRECADALPLHSGRKSVDQYLVWAKGPRQVARKLFDLAYPTGPEISAADRIRIWRRRLGFLVSGRLGWRRAG